MLLQVLVLAIVPLLASAAIFPPGTPVKSLDAKGFKKAMKESRTSLVAFVAPWCGHCQSLAPEYSKAAKSLSPMVPLYAVDCDAEENKVLCGEQRIEGFPTIKLFPRGDKKPPVLYQGERTASAIVEFASRRIPYTVEKLSEPQNVLTWIKEEVENPRALLLTKDKKVPIMWKVLSNKYTKLKFGIHRDSKGTTGAMLGIDSGETSSKVLVYPAGSKFPARYKGSLKYDPLSRFFGSVVDGTAKLDLVNKETKPEEPERTKINLGYQEKEVFMGGGNQANLAKSETRTVDSVHQAEKKIVSATEVADPPSEETVDASTHNVIYVTSEAVEEAPLSTSMDQTPIQPSETNAETSNTGEAAKSLPEEPDDTPLSTPLVTLLVRPSVQTNTVTPSIGKASEIASDAVTDTLFSTPPRSETGTEVANASTKTLSIISSNSASQDSNLDHRTQSHTQEPELLEETLRAANPTAESNDEHGSEENMGSVTLELKNAIPTSSAQPESAATGSPSAEFATSGSNSEVHRPIDEL